MDKPTFFALYKGRSYEFEYGSELVFFQSGVYYDLDQTYGMDELLSYVRFAQDCYLNDDNKTPLCNLADYIAGTWDKNKNLDIYTVLDDFYSEVGVL